MVFIGLVIYCFLVYIRPSDWMQPIMGWPLEFIVLGLTIPAGFLSKMNQAEEKRTAIPLQLYFLFGYILIIFLSNAIHLNVGNAFEQTITFGKRALVVLIFWFGVRSVGKLRGIIFVLVALTALLGWQGIDQTATGIGWAGQTLGWKGRIRWIGLWNGPDVLSLLFVTAMPFVIEMVFGKNNLLTRMFGLVSGILIFIGMLLGLSRGAFVALGVVFLAYSGKRLGKIGLVLGAILAMGLLAYGPDRLRTSDAADDKSTSHRVEMWGEGLEMLRFNPVLGIGKGMFLSYTSKLIAHNLFVENMGELGLLGLFVWLSLVYFSIRAIMLVVDSKDISPQLQSLSRALLISFVAYLSASAFITTDFEPFYILVGLSAAVITLAREETGLELPLVFDRKSIRNIIFIEVSGILSVHLFVLLYFR